MTTSTDNLVKSVHSAFIGFTLRAEKNNETVLLDTFVDSEPLIDIMSTSNSQIIFGRRGTGKTHALKKVSDLISKKHDLPIFLDLRSIGSNMSIYNDHSKTLGVRASQLIQDVLQSINSSFYEIACNSLETHIDPKQITLRLDDFSKAISNFKVYGDIEIGEATTDKASSANSIQASLDHAAQGRLSFSKSGATETEHASHFSARGNEVLHLDFASIQTSLAGLIDVLDISKLWLIIDEWSEVPIELQPYLADLLRRTCMPLEKIVIKIAAIEHRSNFNIRHKKGEYIGFELGADVTANLNLDDFLVFDSDEQKSINFFKSLIYKHYKKSEKANPEITNADQLIKIAFTQKNVFDEFVRASEGVPRDALNLAAKIASKAYGKKISMASVGEAARDWYQQDKVGSIKSDPALLEALTTIVTKVIGDRRARAFLFSSKLKHPKIESLFDARILHILKKNISSNDKPGERYDVYKIDYGGYIDLKNTNQETLGLFQTAEDDEFTQVPKDDYRSIRTAILESTLLDN